MQEKILGYTFLIIGVIVMIFGLISVYSVFTGRAKPYPLFTFKGISLDTSQVAQISLPEELKKAGVEINNQQPVQQELIAPELINSTSNILAHMVLMGFVVTFGFRLARLGTELVRPIVVRVGDKRLQSQSATSGQNSMLVPPSKKG